MKNQTIRQAAKAAGVYLWQIAEEMGISDYALSRKLRHELPEKEAAEIMGIIQKISNQKGAE